MIIRYKYRGILYNFLDIESRKPTKNVFTVIVGKNGSGKSSLLKNIIDHTIQKFEHPSNPIFEGIEIQDSNIKNTKYDLEPSRLIASSTSPFDKFPLKSKTDKRTNDFYKYLGIRDLLSHNLGLAFVGKTVSYLLKSIIDNRLQLIEINKVLKYLGFNEGIELSLTFNRELSKVLWYMVHGKNSLIPELQLLRSDLGIHNGIDELFYQIEKERVYQVYTELLRLGVGNGKNIKRQLKISINNLNIDTPIEDLIVIVYMIRYGVLRLNEFKLTKGDNIVSLTDSSSGQQSVILSILGIASHIRSNSIICIDEPEISLHPEWQEKYIDLLINTFNHFENCHFIIATHSPQIISKLQVENCFIVDMESGGLKNAESYINHSADFQLANIFNSPGFRNEYLSRIALNTFAKVSRKKHFDDEDYESYKLLNSLNNYLDDNDPVKDLLKAIKNLYNLFGKNDK